MRIYTKTGDEGLTGLIGDQRVPKHSVRIHAIGEIDELNAAIGCALATGSAVPAIAEVLERLQHTLFDVGAEVACDPEGEFQMVSVSSADIAFLESKIDLYDKDLAPLTAFILPGGSILAAQLHMARCICRRTERVVLALHDRQPVRSEVRVFLNRLSDYLFAAARFANHAQGVHDIIWKKQEPLP